MKQRQPTRTLPLPRALAVFLMAIFLVAAFFIAAFLLFRWEAQAQDQVIPENIAPIASEVLTGGHYQTDIPGAKSGDADGEPSSPSSSATQSPPQIPEAPVESPPIAAGAAETGTMQIFIYILIAALLALVLVAIFRAYRGSQRRANPDIAQAISAPVIASAPRPAIRDQVEELAAAGDFEAAIHLMLLRALAALRSRLGDLPDSLTSREILRRSNLPRETAQPLSVIIGAVEVSYFGGQTPNAAVYRLCADNYRQFLGGAA